MDQVSQAISTLRVGRGTVRRFRQSGSWGLNYSGLNGSGFHVVLGGTGWLLSATARPRPLRAGDVVLVTSGADHGLSSEPRPLEELPPVELGAAEPSPGPADFEFLCGGYRLAYGQVHPYLAALPDLIVTRVANHAVVQLLDERADEPVRADEAVRADGQEAGRYALMDLMLVDALSQVLAPAFDPAIAAVLRTIDDGPEIAWSVRDLARTAGMSRATFTRRFSAAAGRTPQAYLLERRLGRAARLLRESDAPLSAIARRTGYASEFAFAAAFRRAYGTAPGRFRTAQRDEAHRDAGSLPVG